MKPIKSLEPEIKPNLQFLVTKIVKIIEDEKEDRWKKYKGLIKDNLKKLQNYSKEAQAAWLAELTYLKY